MQERRGEISGGTSVCPEGRGLPCTVRTKMESRKQSTLPNVTQENFTHTTSGFGVVEFYTGIYIFVSVMSPLVHSDFGSPAWA